MLKGSFFDRSALVVAKDLIGKYLMRKIAGKTHRYAIVETESYEGLLDKASHSSKGETARNAPMFGAPGTLYVYFTYGMHYMLNIVCGKKGYPGAVLIRGIVSTEGEEILGPAKITKLLKIDKSLNNVKLGKLSGLWIEDKPKLHTHISGDRLLSVYGKNDKKIISTPRIGIDSAGEKWVKKKYRFIIKKYEYKKFK